MRRIFYVSIKITCLVIKNYKLLMGILLHREQIYTAAFHYKIEMIYQFNLYFILKCSIILIVLLGHKSILVIFLFDHLIIYLINNITICTSVSWCTIFVFNEYFRL